MKRFALLLLALGLLVPGMLRAQSYAPAVDYLSLMGMRYYAHSGGFMLDGLQVVFPPDEAIAGTFTVTDAAGETVVEMPLRLTRSADYPAFGWLQSVGVGIANLDAPGDYTMTVILDGTTIATLDYTLTAEESGDPFDPQTTYFREGPWAHLAYLSANADRPDDALRFNYWTSLRELGTEGQTKIALQLTRGGSLVARSRSDYVASSPHWQYFSHPLLHPDGKHVFTLADLTETDGTYQLALLSEGTTVKTYAVQVANGAVVPSPRSALPTEPRPDFLTPRRVNTSAGSTSRYFIENVFWVTTQDATP